MLGYLRRPGSLDFWQIFRDRERGRTEGIFEQRHSVAWMNNSCHKMNLLAKGNLGHRLIFELLEGGEDRGFLKVGEAPAEGGSPDGPEQFFGFQGGSFEFRRFWRVIAGVP